MFCSFKFVEHQDNDGNSHFSTESSSLETVSACNQMTKQDQSKSPERNIQTFIVETDKDARQVASVNGNAKISEDCPADDKEYMTQPGCIGEVPSSNKITHKDEQGLGREIDSFGLKKVYKLPQGESALADEDLTMTDADVNADVTHNILVKGNAETQADSPADQNTVMRQGCVGNVPSIEQSTHEDVQDLESKMNSLALTKQEKRPNESPADTGDPEGPKVRELLSMIIF